MCSWCWGFAPCWEQLQQQLPDQITVEWLLGGLAAESSEAMPEPMQRYLQQTWREIEQKIPSRQFNHDFWRNNQPRRSTYPACRAVIAARQLTPQAGRSMVAAIQRGYYQRALNPSDEAVLQQLAGELGLAPLPFMQQLHAKETEQQLQQEISHCRALGVSAFPALVLQSGEQHYTVPVDYQDPLPMLYTITQLLQDHRK